MSNKDTKKFIFFGLIALSVVLTAVGISQGQHLGVLSKAVTICLECVGIG